MRSVYDYKIDQMMLQCEGNGVLYYGIRVLNVAYAITYIVKDGVIGGVVIVTHLTSN